MEKSLLPIKTKIAAWWMIVISGVFSLLYLHLIFAYYMFVGPEDMLFMEQIPTFLLCLSSLIAALFLFKRKKWAWWFSIIVMSYTLLEMLLIGIRYIPRINFIEGLGTVIFVFSPWKFTFGSYIFFLIPVIPLIFLLLDRKNFWKIAS